MLNCFADIHAYCVIMSRCYLLLYVSIPIPCTKRFFTCFADPQPDGTEERPEGVLRHI